MVHHDHVWLNLAFPLIGLIELSFIIFRDYFDVDLFHFMIWGIPYCVLHPPKVKQININRMLKQ